MNTTKQKNLEERIGTAGENDDALQRLLVVEDNPLFRDAAQRYFGGKSGVEVDFAVDYTTAMERLNCGSRYDGAIIDCFFPEDAGRVVHLRGDLAVEKLLQIHPEGKILREIEAYVPLGELEGIFRRNVEKYAYVEAIARRDRMCGDTDENKGTPEHISLLEGLSSISSEISFELKIQIVQSTFSSWQFYDNYHYSRSIFELLRTIRQKYSTEPSYQPLGILIAEEAEAEGIPFVLATSTFHHDGLTQPICDYQRRNRWPELVDVLSDSEEYKVEPKGKDTPLFWKEAYEVLERERVKVKTNLGGN